MELAEVSRAAAAAYTGFARPVLAAALWFTAP